MAKRRRFAKPRTIVMAMAGFCILAGLLIRAFYRSDVVADFAGVAAMLGIGFVARFGRVGFSRKFPFVKFRIGTRR